MMQTPQCKDISTADFLAAVEKARQLTAAARGWPVDRVTSATRWDVGAVLSGRPDLVQTPELHSTEGLLPDRLVLAKVRQLKRRGLVDGCACGCNGDLRVPPAVDA